MKWKLPEILAIASFLIVSCAMSPSINPESPLSAEATVNPSVPTVTPATPAAVVRVGTFVAGEHPTRGMVRIVTQNGQQFVELGEDFKTSEMGPDLVVILHQAPNVLETTRPPAYPLTEGSYVVLSPLQQFQGAQRYAIPAHIRASDYASAAIWCRRFNATFGAAALRSM